MGSRPPHSIPSNSLPSPHICLFSLFTLSPPLLPSFLISPLLFTPFQYVAGPRTANASAPSRSLVPSTLSAILLVQSTISMPPAPASELSTISSITPLISTPAQRAQALPPLAVIVSPSLPPKLQRRL